MIGGSIAGATMITSLYGYTALAIILCKKTGIIKWAKYMGTGSCFSFILTCGFK